MSNANTVYEDPDHDFARLRKTPQEEPTTQSNHSHHSHGKTNSIDFQGSKRPMPTFFNSKKGPAPN